MGHQLITLILLIILLVGLSLIMFFPLVIWNVTEATVNCVDRWKANRENKDKS